jgi:hypothetical protein
LDPLDVLPTDQQVRDFLRAVLPRRNPDERIETRMKTTRGMTSRMHQDLSQLLHWATANRTRGDIWFGVGVRSRYGGRGNQAVTRLGCLWADLDCKGDWTREKRLAQLQGLAIPPHALVDSGSGYHAYWILDQPTEDKKRAQWIMKRMHRSLDSDAVHDPARILRLPGTLNFKTDPPMLVRVLWLHHACTTLDELDKLVPVYSREEVMNPLNKSSTLSSSSGQWSTQETLAGVPEGERDNALYQLACRLHRAGVPRQQAAMLMQQAAANCVPPFDEAEAIHKVTRVYVTDKNPNHGVAWNLPKLQPLDEAPIAQLIGRAEADIEYLPCIGQPGYFVTGWSHLVAGYPRCGKTEFLTHLCSEWSALGKSIVYISEESVDVWARRARLHHLEWTNMNVVFGLGHDPSRLFSRAFGGSEHIVIMDTLRQLFALRGETDNSKLAEVINPWVSAARSAGKTFVLAHHNRKGGGQHGEGIAGGHGLLGMFDIAIEILRDPARDNRRILRPYARLISPPDMLYGLENDRFVSLGTPAAASAATTAEDVVNVLEGTGVWMCTADIMNALDPRPSEATLRRALQVLWEEKRIERIPPAEGKAQGVTVFWHAATGQPTAAPIFGQPL